MKVKMMRVEGIEFSATSKVVYDPTPSADLKRSIRKFGVLVRPVVDQHGRLISGHRRVSEEKANGAVEIEVEEREVKDDKEYEALVFEFNRQRRPTWRQRYLEALHYECELEDDFAVLKAKGNAPQKPLSEWVREELEEVMGFSHETWAQLQKVGRHAPKLLDEIDSGKLRSLNAAYKKLKTENPELFEKRRSARRPAEKPDGRKVGTFDNAYALGWRLGGLVDLGVLEPAALREDGGLLPELMRGLVAGLRRQEPEFDLRPHAVQVEGWCPALAQVRRD